YRRWLGAGRGGLGLLPRLLTTRVCRRDKCGDLVDDALREGCPTRRGPPETLARSKRRDMKPIGDYPPPLDGLGILSGRSTSCYGWLRETRRKPAGFSRTRCTT